MMIFCQNCPLLVTRRCRLFIHPFKEGVTSDSPVTDNPKTKIMELHLDNGDDLKYISQFRLCRETVIDQKHHYSLLFYVQQLHNKIALLERKISLNNSSISGYKDSSLATTVYTRRRDVVASITSSHATEVVGEIFHTRKFCHTQVSSCTHLNLLESPCFWYCYQPFLLSLSLQSYKDPAETCVPSSIGISSPTSPH